MKKAGKARRALPFAAVTEGWLLLMLTVFPLFCGFEGYSRISEAKFALFCILCGGYAGLMLLLGLEGLLIGAVKPVSPLALLKKSSWPQRFVLLYMAFTWVSALASPFFPDTVVGMSRYEGALSLTLYGLCFLLLSVWGKARARLLAALGGSVTLLCILCFLQLLGLNPLSLYPAGLNYYDAGVKYVGEYLGTIGNTDLLAAFFCLVIPVFWIALLRLRDRRRFLLLIPLALSLTVLLWMRVLAGLLGVFLGGLLCLPAVLPAGKRLRRGLAAAVLALLLLALAAFYFADAGAGLAHELHELLHGRGDPAFGSGRLFIWRQVWERLPARLLFGAGPDTMLAAGLAPFQRVDAATGRTVVAQIDAAHNEYLNVLFHQGLFALLSYLGLLLSLARRRLREARERPLSAMLGGAALCCCVQAFFGISTPITAPLFWLALALPEGGN